MNYPKALSLYFAFAGLSIGVNVMVQRLVFALYSGPHTIVIAMFTGACLALMTKYILDRRFVFRMKSKTVTGEFVRYSLTGAAITLVFFALEYTVWTLYKTDLSRDIGIVLGMAVGYGLKFIIDQQFVFLQEKVES